MPALGEVDCAPDFENNESLCVVIENKMGADESQAESGETQLERYYKAVNESPYRDATNQVFIYLTPNGKKPLLVEGSKEPKHHKKWVPVSYEQLIEVLGEALSELESRQPRHVGDTRKLIEDFIADMKKKTARDEYEADIRKEFEKSESQINALLADLEASTDRSVVAEFDEKFSADRRKAKLTLEAIQDVLSKGKQDHTKNPVSQKLIRMIFNELTAESHKLPTNNASQFGSEPNNQRTRPINRDNRSYELPGLTDVRLAGGPGQGLYLHYGETGWTIYVSADREGKFPDPRPHFYWPKSKEGPLKGLYKGQPPVTTVPNAITQRNLSDVTLLDNNETLAEYARRFVEELDAALILRQKDGLDKDLLEAVEGSEAEG